MLPCDVRSVHLLKRLTNNSFKTNLSMHTQALCALSLWQLWGNLLRDQLRLSLISWETSSFMSAVLRVPWKSLWRNRRLSRSMLMTCVSHIRKVFICSFTKASAGTVCRYTSGQLNEESMLWENWTKILSRWRMKWLLIQVKTAGYQWCEWNLESNEIEWFFRSYTLT